MPEEEEEEKISVASNTTGEKLVTAPSIIPGGGVLPMIAYTWRLRPKGVSFSGLRYMKG